MTLIAHSAPERFRLFNRFWSAPAAVCLLIETLLIYGAVWVAYQIRFVPVHFFPYNPLEYHSRALIFVAVIIAALYLNGLYDFQKPMAARREFILVLRSLAFAVVAQLAVFYLIPSLWLGRGFLALALLLASLALLLSRALLRVELKNRLFSERVLIVGCDKAAVDLAKAVLERKHLGYEVVGFIADDPQLQGVSLVNPKVLADTRHACDVALQQAASRVVVAQLDQRGQMSLDGLLECESHGIPVERSSSYYEELTGKVLLDGPRVRSWLLFSGGLVVARPTLLVKRILDLLVSLASLTLGVPLLLLAAAAIKLDSPGPVFYRQTRTGRHGKLFKIVKLRSMRIDAESGGACWASEGDRRVTRVGRLLRRSHLDELPQLWNVLKGDMSLVGPRPERPEFVEYLTASCPLYKERLVVRPGITGWAQIMAPYAASLEDSKEKLKLDLYYIKNLSVFLDLSILASTMKIAILGRGAR